MASATSVFEMSVAPDAGQSPDAHNRPRMPQNASASIINTRIARSLQQLVSDQSGSQQSSMGTQWDSYGSLEGIDSKEKGRTKNKSSFVSTICMDISSPSPLPSLTSQPCNFYLIWLAYSDSLSINIYYNMYIKENTALKRQYYDKVPSCPSTYWSALPYTEGGRDILLSLWF